MPEQLLTKEECKKLLEYIEDLETYIDPDQYFYYDTEADKIKEKLQNA